MGSGQWHSIPPRELFRPNYQRDRQSNRVRFYPGEDRRDRTRSREKAQTDTEGLICLVAALGNWILRIIQSGQWLSFVIERFTSLPLHKHNSLLEDRIQDPQASPAADRIQPSTRREDTAFLTYQAQQWHNSLDPALRADDDQDVVGGGLSPARNRLRILDHLRKNQLLMLIHRKALFTPTSIAADPRGAKSAVDLARTTITMLDKIRKTSEIYKSHAVCFNYFLYSALTVILLAAYHAKARFHEYCREEFNMAFNLIGRISANSNVARKLWKIIKHLKVMGPELGILPYMETQQDNPRQGRDDYPGSNDKTVAWTQNQAQIFDGVVNYPVQVLPDLRQMYSLSNPISHGDIPMFTSNYTVDGDLLCSELTDLFQAINSTKFEQIPSQQLDQSRCQPSIFPTPQTFSRTVRNVF